MFNILHLCLTFRIIDIVLTAYPQCDTILLRYSDSGTTIQQCTVRYNPISQQTIVYWKIKDCLSWPDAKKACGVAAGKLASFPEVDDKAYMERFVSPFINARMTASDKCYVPVDNLNYGIWVGVSRKSSSSSEWTWEDGTVEQDDDIAWEHRAGFYGSKEYVPTGNCGFVGFTFYCFDGNGNCGESIPLQGFIRASCDLKTHAVCMKNLS